MARAELQEVFEAVPRHIQVLHPRHQQTLRRHFVKVDSILPVLGSASLGHKVTELDSTADFEGSPPHKKRLDDGAGDGQHIVQFLLAQEKALQVAPFQSQGEKRPGNPVEPEVPE